MIEIPKSVLDKIENTPELVSMLYDLDMMPEQLKSDGAKHGLRGCYYIFMIMQKERDELKSKLELIRKVAIPNSQGNSMIPTSLIFDEVSE